MIGLSVAKYISYSLKKIINDLTTFTMSFTLKLAIWTLLLLGALVFNNHH